MLSDWYAQYFGTAGHYIIFGDFTIWYFPHIIFGWVMMFLTLWAMFHLTTDIIMAFRAVFGFGYKKMKGGSH